MTNPFEHQASQLLEDWWKCAGQLSGWAEGSHSELATTPSIAACLSPLPGRGTGGSRDRPHSFQRAKHLLRGAFLVPVLVERWVGVEEANEGVLASDFDASATTGTTVEALRDRERKLDDIPIKGSAPERLPSAGNTRGHPGHTAAWFAAGLVIVVRP